MKRIISIMICVILTSINCISISAEMSPAPYITEFYTYDKGGIRQQHGTVTIMDNKTEHGDLIIETYTESEVEVPEYIMDRIIKERERFTIIDVKVSNSENPYPDIDATEIVFEKPFTPEETDILNDGFLGEFYYLDPVTLKISEIYSDSITENAKRKISFMAEKTGVYFFIFDPLGWDIHFYREPRIYDEKGNLICDRELYVEYKNVDSEETIVFPEIPQKEGYVFVGWRAEEDTSKMDASLSLAAAGGGGAIGFRGPQPICPMDVGGGNNFYATWCKEEEYVPLTIHLDSEPITKGKENGCKITLKTNYGIFVKDIHRCPPHLDSYEEGDVYNWREYWKIVGSDELLVELIERIDDKTVEITLSGNSSDIYTESEINVEFLYNLLLPEPVIYEGELVTDYHTKIKMDEDGVMAKWYRSDNAITLERQKRVNSGSGGGGTTANYTVTFADGESKETVKVKQNAKVSEPEVPEKEGYVFDGWYLDEKYTVAYDFSAKVTRNFTLYAKWDKAEESQIILTVGEKEAVVNGETKLNDVAPMIKADRAYLPARFVAESLGADVLWDAEAKTVTIRKDDTEIILTIGEKDAEINGETVASDAEPFLENDRTYTPIRLIAEALGAKVEWDEETKMITITTN